MERKLEGKVALVTGAGRGIGKEIAIRLAQEGADVIVNYASSKAGAEQVADQIRAMGRRSLTIQTNIAHVDAVQAMFRQVFEAFDHLDILVNNAALDPTIPFLEVTEDQYDRVMGSNLKGTYFCTQMAARHMIEKGIPGRIIIIGSMHSMATFPGMSVYAATKGGLNALTRALSLELAPKKITVNCVIPGSIHVEKNYDVIPGYDPHMVDNSVPLGRIGYGADIAGAVAFMASKDADYITGTTLTVDGGIMARMALGFSEINTVERKYD